MNYINKILFPIASILIIGCASNPDIGSKTFNKFEVEHPLYVKFNKKKRQFDVNLYPTLDKKSLGFRLDNLQSLHTPTYYKKDYMVYGFGMSPEYKCDDNFFGRTTVSMENFGISLGANLVMGVFTFGIEPLIMGFPYGESCIFDKNKFNKYKILYLNKYKINRQKILNTYNKQFDILNDIKYINSQILDNFNIKYIFKNNFQDIINKETPCNILDCNKIISNGYLQLSEIKKHKVDFLNIIRKHPNINILISLYNKEKDIDLKNILKKRIIVDLNNCSINTLMKLEKKYKHSVFIINIIETKIKKILNNTSNKNILNVYVNLYKKYSHNQKIIQFLNKKLATTLENHKFTINELIYLKTHIRDNIEELNHKLLSYYTNKLIKKNALDSIEGCPISRWQLNVKTNNIGKPIGTINYIKCNSIIADGLFNTVRLVLILKNAKIKNDLSLSGGIIEAYVRKCSFTCSNTSIYTKHLSDNDNIVDSFIRIANKAIGEYNNKTTHKTSVIKVKYEGYDNSNKHYVYDLYYKGSYDGEIFYYKDKDTNSYVIMTTGISKGNSVNGNYFFSGYNNLTTSQCGDTHVSGIDEAIKKVASCVIKGHY